MKAGGSQCHPWEAMDRLCRHRLFQDMVDRTCISDLAAGVRQAAVGGPPPPPMGREHSLSFNPLRDASTSQPAVPSAFAPGRSGSGYWGEARLRLLPFRSLTVDRRSNFSHLVRLLLAQVRLVHRRLVHRRLVRHRRRITWIPRLLKRGRLKVTIMKRSRV